jgi:hypothetical protein
MSAWTLSIPALSKARQRRAPKGSLKCGHAPEARPTRPAGPAAPSCRGERRRGMMADQQGLTRRICRRTTLDGFREVGVHAASVTGAQCARPIGHPRGVRSSRCGARCVRALHDRLEPRARARHRPAPQLEQRHLDTAFTASLVLGAGLGAIIWLGAPLAADFMHMEVITQDDLRCSLAPTHPRAAPDPGRPSLRDLVLAWSLFAKSTSTSAHSHAGQSRRGNRSRDCREIVIQRHRTRTRRPTLLVSRLSRIEPQGVGASMDAANTTCWEIQQCAA